MGNTDRESRHRAPSDAPPDELGEDFDDDEEGDPHETAKIFLLLGKLP